MNKYYFIMTKQLLFSINGTMFRKLNRFLGNFRIEGENYLGDIIISFYSDEPIKEAETNEVEIWAERNMKGSWYFTKIIYLKNQ